MSREGHQAEVMLEKAPVTETTARRLQEMIRSGEFAVGSRIPSQRVLSDMLQVSRPSLREALLTLETLGLVRTLPARGTFVVDKDAQPPSSSTWRYDDLFSLEDVFQTRILIECELCRTAALNLEPTTLRQIEGYAVAFEQAWKQGDLVAHVEADLSLHRAIAEASPNHMLRRIYESVQTFLTESQRQPVPTTARERMAQSIAEHGEIVAALRTGSGDLAHGAMHKHIMNTAACAGVDLP